MRVLTLVAFLLPGLALAQDRAQTLADIRAELSQLNAQFTALKQELVTTGAAQTGIAGGSALERLNTIEAELMRLNAKTEEVELRLNRVVQDGSLRLNDLEFRVVEMEGGDLSQVGQAPPLGGEAPVAAFPAPTTPPAGTPELAMGEQADFDRAKGVLGQGDFRTAADLFAAFATAYPGGPLSQEAQFLRGEALENLGDTANSARAYLEAFSGQPDGPRAAEALFRLGRQLGALGQGPEACVTLTEVGARFPGSQAAADAAAAMAGLGCQ
ncbi:tol-pal system protein YbgF [Aliigemmobacter aestuarii]|uniref:Cell division coordinator CpoB n=1 Tax=Aliigemmobacter aestuarii TaxID=1445661 RepID=A0A4S3MV68_9RHOB|nr:tol-pal system protein YbgF [Gemmobacter aestuarii]THD85855.1 tol-pal system protein YbgF [Gemmobacter aestuarii]